MQTRTKPIETALAKGSRIAVIGGGIAALCATLALQRSGYRVLRLRPTQPKETPASRAPRVLVCPRLRRRGTREADFLEQATTKAQHFYNDAEVEQRGAVRIAQTARDPQRMHMLAQDYPSLCCVREGQALEALTAIPNARLASCGLFFPQALLLDTAKLLDRLERATHCETRSFALRAYRFDRARGCYRLFGDQGELPCEGVEALVLAVGSALPDLLPSPWQSILERTIGRIDRCPRTALRFPPRLALCASGWIVPQRDDVLVVRGLARARQQDAKAENRARLDAWCGCKSAICLSDSSAFLAPRLATRDRMPLLGRIEDGTWLFGALGGHGFLTAPLMAEWLALSLAGAPRREQRLLCPRRFEAKFYAERATGASSGSRIG